jgi:putative ABC transport system permease protein
MIPIRYNLRSLVVRRATTVATGLGIAVVVFVFASALMLSAGVRQTLVTGGSRDIALVMRKGGTAEIQSVVEASQLDALYATPGVKQDSSGRSLASPELVLVLTMRRASGVGRANVQIRGVEPSAAQMRSSFRIVEGRAPMPGSDEAIVGVQVRGRFEGLELGKTFEVHKGRRATIVGVFEAGNSSYESEVWLDLTGMQAALLRAGLVSSVRLRLESPEAFDSFKSVVESDKRFGYSVTRETDYFQSQSEGVVQIVTLIGTLISTFFCLCAMAGAMITMYAAIANRQREIGVLRALGFPRRSILLSFLVEALLLTITGGSIGAVAALGMSFLRIPILNYQSMSELVFKFDASPRIIVESLILAAVLGLFGGLLPAVRAARVSPLLAVRA